ncbi:MAG: hypothetical protein JNL82_15945 [Myxococcales bacterium]|nr:hypothetical protein [Myxococcales bacterium]
MLASLALELMLSPLALAGEPRACEDGGFAVHTFYPQDGYTDVPTDGVVVFTGSQPAAGASGLTVDVDVGGQKLAGTLEVVAGDVWVWRKDGAFAADTAYHVFARDAVDIYEFTFTTGDEPAAPPVAVAVDEVKLRQVEHAVIECLQETVCGCVEEQVVDTEVRIRADVSLPDAPEPFGAVNRALIQFAPDVGSFTDAGASDGSWPIVGGTSRAHDLGLAGSWPGDEVCVRVSTIDPLGRRADGEAKCVPIGEVNEPPPEEGEAGCGCAAAGGGLPALVVLVPLMRRRRARGE